MSTWGGTIGDNKNMKSTAFVFAIMTGYVGITFGILKIFWRQFDVHFYAPGVSHPPQADLALDSVLIAILILSGLGLVLFRNVIPCLISLIAAFFFEFLFLHDGPHQLWQYAFAIGAIVGQVITLAVYISAYTTIGNKGGTGRASGPSRGRFAQKGY